MKKYFKFAGLILAAVVLIGAIAAAWLMSLHRTAEKNRDLLASEFAVGKPVTGLVEKANQLGASAFVVNAEKDEWFKTHGALERTLPDFGERFTTFRDRFADLKSGAVEVQFSGILYDRFFFNVTFQDGVVTNVKTNSLD